ncbi:SGNH/GDSL hydrolase family protein [Mycolicibacterium hodleri]|uniref:SGNH/GDSL hydrolase family protein n=1 Tax=Mycolicibacterium hodleri TaxID=49897 RepID=A0A502EB70_9MYCO|nr:SGNH/GDSL hydrolase family protein [Mycolicibacterium hodleri]TPG33766.1 SGNH/GDSL hydrolase family protein [Mycolicibacterium hodleri]
MADESYLRYVALGDSQTEGLWDGDDTSGVAGFADRLAARLDERHTGVLYANLAVRGRRIRDVLESQLPAAVAMRPDLITSCIGMNDVTRPGKSFAKALEDIDLLHDRLAETGATVVTTTFPDLEKILPVGRVLGTRVVRINAVIRAAAARHGFRLVDLYVAESMGDPDVWSSDRVHGSPAGHTLFAAAAAEALELPGSNHDWAISNPAAVAPDFRSRMYSQALWTQNLLMPYLWRHVRGLSSGNGRDPKRPRLQPVVSVPEALEALEAAESSE